MQFRVFALGIFAAAMFFTSAANAQSSFSFTGIGLTTGFQGRTPLFEGSSLSLLWGGRASVLWGEDERRILVGALVDDPSATAGSTNGGDETNRAIAYIVEAQLGLVWRRELRSVPMSAYIHVAFEYQYWNLGDGTLSRTATTAGVLPAPPEPSLAPRLRNRLAGAARLTTRRSRFPSRL